MALGVTSKKRSGASSGSKKNKKPKTKGSLFVPSLKLFSGFPPKGAADPIRDKAVSKALAVQATFVPKIPPAVVIHTAVILPPLLKSLRLNCLIKTLPRAAL